MIDGGGSPIRRQDVIFKGTGRSLKVVIAEGADFQSALAGIEEKLALNPAFYAGQRITVEQRSGLIPDAQSEMIRAVFRRYNVPCAVADVKGASEKAAALITQTALKDETPPTKKDQRHGRKAPAAPAAIYEGDLVPGKSIVHEGSVVILGDVLPGGSVRAGGDVIITGIAGGAVSAGWPDDKTARIIAGGFAAGRYAVGPFDADVKEAHGSSVRMMAIKLGPEGLFLQEGEAGLVSRRGEGN